MEKRISFSQFQQVKNAARMCNPLVIKREAVKAKIEKLAEEYKGYNTQIEALTAGIKNVTGFYPEQLVKKVVESGVDGNGQSKKTVKYLPTNIVAYDEVKKQYVITTLDEPANNEYESASSDYNEPTTAVEEAPIPSEETVPADAPIFE